MEENSQGEDIEGLESMLKECQVRLRNVNEKLSIEKMRSD